MRRLRQTPRPAPHRHAPNSSVTAATTGTTPTRRSPLNDLRRKDTNSMDDDNAPPMRPGQRYQVRYRSGSQRRDRTAVMVYLGEDGDSLLFDARPAAGTQRMPRPFSRKVVALHIDSVGPLPICRPTAWNSGYLIIARRSVT